jgi:WD repeat-containing protein 48
MSLATLRAHVWKGGADVVLHYRANGKREIPKMVKEEAEGGHADAAGGSGGGGADGE